MKKNYTLFLSIFLICLAVAATASAPPPTDAFRVGGSCAWVDGKVIAAGGIMLENYVDIAGKEYMTNNGSAGVGIYDPTTDTWASAKYDGTGPLGFDGDLNGTCDYNTNWSRAGFWTQTNQSVAYDGKFYFVAGFQHDDGPIWCYDPPSVGTPRGSWSLTTSNTDWGGFRRGAVGLYGSKIFLASGTNGTQFGSYDIATDTWTTYSSSSPEAQMCGSTVCNGKFYVVGGDDFAGAIYACDLANPDGGFTQVGTLLLPVAFPAVVNYNGIVYVFGGQTSDGNPTNNIQSFDPSTGTARNLTAEFAVETPNAAWSMDACIDPATGTVYIGGGGTGGDIFRPEGISPAWYEADITNLLTSGTISFVGIGNDPSDFPYEDWVSDGAFVTGRVLDPDGNGFPNAIVGIKDATNAAADALAYATTDDNGYFGPVEVLATSTYCAAWSTNWAPSIDYPLALTIGETTDQVLQITDMAGKNLSISELGRTVGVDSDSEDPGCPKGDAIDGNLGTRWSNDQSLLVDDESLYINLDAFGGVPLLINGVTIYWELARPQSYSIEYTTDFPDIFANWTEAYSTTTGGGYDIGGDAFVDSIRFDTDIEALAVRVHCTERKAGFNGYSAWEVQVHSATEILTLVSGTVTDVNNNPVAGAIVGTKSSAGAITDAPFYGVTDENGNYGPITSGPGWYVAAWTEGWTPTADATVPSGGGFVTAPNLQITAPAGKNLSLDAVGVSATSWESDNYLPALAVDGNIGTYWASFGGDGNPQSLIVDLGSALSINGFTIWWADGIPPAYTIQGMVGGDPLVEDWDNPGVGVTVSTIYESVNANGGYAVEAGWVFVDPIKVDATARGLRLLMQPTWIDTVREFMVHSATEETRWVSGTVTDPDNNPVADAIVGFKRDTTATADAIIYATTDGDGNYGPINIDGTVYMAAWKEGWTPTADATAPSGGGLVTAPNLQLTAPAGVNLAAGALVTATSWESDDYLPTNAVDSNLDSYWATTNLEGEVNPQALIVDLGSDLTINAVTIWWADGIPPAYTIQGMVGGDPLVEDWDNPGVGVTVTTIYEGVNVNGGYKLPDPPYWETYVDPIPLAEATVRGVRILMPPAFIGAAPVHTVREFQVHSATETITMVSGTVTDVDNNPVADAIVGFKSDTFATADASIYATTDENGHYGPIPADAGMYVAAWKEGWTPTADATVPSGGGLVTAPNLQLTATAGANLAAGALVSATSWESEDYAPTKAVDSDMDTYWATTNLEGEVNPQALIVDLGSDLTINDVVIWLADGIPASYVVQTMAGGDPLVEDWDNPGVGVTVTTVYECLSGNGGYKLPDPPYWETYAEPIPVAEVTARGVRILMQPVFIGAPVHSVREFQVHGQAGSIYTPVELSDIATLEDGALVAVTGVELTAIPSVGGVPAGVAYVETADRSCGIRLDTTAVTLAEVIGDVIDFQGVVGTTLEGEKYVALDSVGYVSHSDPTIAELGMNNRFANDGLTRALFVKVWGNVVESGTDYFVISDGSVDSSGTPITIRVSCASGTAPTSGLVAVSGVLSTDGTSAILYKTD